MKILLSLWKATSFKVELQQSDPNPIVKAGMIILNHLGIMSISCIGKILPHW